MVGFTENHFVVVGLGNPGSKYELTRHNIGNLVVKFCAQRMGLSFKEEKRFHAMVAKGKVQSSWVHLILPLTYMNESGRAVGNYLGFYKLKPGSVLIVCDDVELPFGQLRLRAKGRSGGHNGLKSIEAHLGTQEYLRLKMGVGKNLMDATLADYVLGIFRPEEVIKLESFVNQGVEVVKSLLSEPSVAVMNKVNKSLPANCEASPKSPNTSIQG